MFKEVLGYELRYRFSKISTWVYFSVITSLAFLAIFASSGVIKSFDVTLGDTSGKVYLNSPFVIFMVVASWTYFMLLIVSAFMSNAVYRDFSNGSFPMYFTKPISKNAFLWGRFLGNYITLLFILSGAAVGLFLATILPIYEPDQIGPFSLSAFVQPYLVMGIPNLLIMGAAFFSVTILFRKLTPVYVLAVIFFSGYMMGLRLTDELSNRLIAALIDPLGLVSVFSTQLDYWTIAEKNTRLLPVDRNFLLNRVLWTSLSAIWLMISIRIFKFSQFASVANLKKIGKRVSPENQKGTPQTIDSLFRENASAVSRSFSFSFQVKLFFMRSFSEFSKIAESSYFLIIMLTGMLFVMINSKYIGYISGTPGYPVTYKVLETIKGEFIVFILIIITFFSGELVFRERDRNMQQIYDSFPVPDWLIYPAKLIALIYILILCLMIIMTGGVFIQMIKGYFHFEFSVYLKTLLGFTLIDYIPLAVIGMTFHILSNNKYVGHFLMILFYINYAFLQELGINDNLLRFGQDPGYRYSDMNGFGPFTVPYFHFKLYWLLFSMILMVISYLFWVRGYPIGFRNRLRIAGKRFTKKLKILTILLIAGFFGSGGYIYYNTHVLNHYRSRYENQELSAQYEKKYKKYSDKPQPRITAVSVNLDIFPEKRAFRVRGKYTLKNKTEHAMDSLYITLLQEDEIIHTLAPDRPFETTLTDPEHLFTIFHLKSPLEPGDEMALHFDLEYRPRGFPNDHINTDVVANGTFINNKAYFPNIGYQDTVELSRDVTRKRHGLKPKDRMPDVNDLKARMNNYICNDADWIDFETTVSTASDQIAIAPGYLQKKWTENGRTWFTYKMDSPILNFYAFNSGIYQVRKDSWKDVSIEIYYHKGHEFNLDRMIRAIKKSLDYYTENYSPYQHRQIRIVEFPRYQGFAQSFPNTIPYSEAIGFIAKVSDDGIDYPFQVTAHETSHQWWAHQVIGGNAQGATLLSEVMAQYSSLMVFRKQYGENLTRKYLRYELDRYLRGRSFETKKEQPLERVENQQYIHYYKGSIVMNALQDYIGEKQLNTALAGYIRDVAFQDPPYTNSVEFIEHIRDATPEKYKSIITDMFEKIILFDNQAESATCEALDNGQFKVDIDITARKYEAGDLGELQEIPVNDWIDIGVLDKYGTFLFHERKKIDKEKMHFTVLVKEKPYEAGIDPGYKLIDREPDNNVVKIKMG